MYANSGRGFSTMVHLERLAFTWGDVKNGKLGIDIEQEEVKDDSEESSPDED